MWNRYARARSTPLRVRPTRWGLCVPPPAPANITCRLSRREIWLPPPSTAANLTCRLTRRGFLLLPPSTAPRCTTAAWLAAVHNFVSRRTLPIMYAYGWMRHTRWGHRTPPPRLTRCCLRGLVFISAPAKAHPTSHVRVGHGVARPRTCAQARVWCALAGAALVSWVASPRGGRGSARPLPPDWEVLVLPLSPAATAPPPPASSCA